MAEKIIQVSDSFEKVMINAYSSIFEEGEKGDAAYMILHGRVEIRKGTNTDDPKTLAQLKPGDIFGEMALFDDRPRMAMAIAMTDVVVIRLKRDEFLRRLSEMDVVMRNMTLTMVSRTRKMADEFMRQRGEQHWAKIIMKEFDF